MLNFGYCFARWAGGLRRTAYRALLPAIGRTTVGPSRSIPLDVYSYSGEAMVPEQVRSIRSFLRHAGRPQSFTVVSDGTHSERSMELLSKIDPSVAIRRAEEYPAFRFTGKVSSLRHGSSAGQTTRPDHVAPVQRAGIVP